MKKMIMICTTLSFLIVPISLSANNDASVQKINNLEHRMLKLTNKIDKIVTNSRKVKAISEKYKNIAMEHLEVVAKFTEQKGACQNLEDVYVRKKLEKKLDRRVIRQQANNVVECYDMLDTLIYDFENMSRDFSKLKVSIGTLKDMSETDEASIRTLEKQAKVIESLIKVERYQATLSRDEVEKTIDDILK